MASMDQLYATALSHLVSDADRLRVSSVIVDLLQQINAAIGALAGTVAAVTSHSAAVEGTRSVATARTLFSITGYNSLGASQYIQIFDAAAPPGAGTVPLAVLKASPNFPFAFDFGSRGIALTNGISVCNSSTATTYTAGLADCLYMIAYSTT